MWHNVYLYLIFLLYIIAAVFVVIRRKNLPWPPYAVFLALCLPAFLLLLVGVWIGAGQLPRHKVMIHGYRLAVPSDGAFTIGSDPGVDDIRFNYRHKRKEMIDPSILRVSFAGVKGNVDYYLTQTRDDSANVITVDDRPIRSLSLEPGKVHRISFGHYNYSETKGKVLEVEIRNNKPVFRFAGQEFSEDFSRSLIWGAIRWPYSDGTTRHLAFRGRVRLPGTGGMGASELLRQAAIIRYKGGYLLAANDADIRLDGLDFPTTVGVASNSVVRLATRQLGTGRWSKAFKIAPPDQGRASIQFLKRKVVVLDEDSDIVRLCLTANETYYSRAMDISDVQFPTGGVIIDRELDQFIFRAEYLELGKTYLCGKAVFSIDVTRNKDISSVAWFGIMFLLSVFFLPPNMVRREPLIGVVVSASLFLLAFRQVLCFRAWQGPPYKASIVMDSQTAPYLFMLLLIVFSTRFRIVGLSRHFLIRFRNFLLPGNRIPAGARGNPGIDGFCVLGLTLFGVLIYLLFANLVGEMFLVLTLLFFVVFLVFNMLTPLEEHIYFLSSARMGQIRWKPMVWLMPALVGLVLAAPLLGGREVIALLPGRPRPDIFLQLLLLFLVAYFASIWVKEKQRGIPRISYIFVSFAIAVMFPFIQGVMAKDMGFFVMMGLPLLLVLVAACWHLDNRIRMVLVLGLTFILISPLLFKLIAPSLEQVAMRRIAFFLEPERLKAQYFFEYLAHLPMLWAGNQGLLGGGFFHGDWYSALSETSVNDNVASVFIQGELGGIGSVLTMAVFGVISSAGLVFVNDHRTRARGYRIWFLFGISLTLIWTAATMFLGNFGYFPLTGKNLPLLGLDSLNDVVRYGLLLGFSVRYMDMIKEKADE